MDGNEKGYFKKFASIHSTKSSNNYLRLFDALDKQKEYDEQRIKKKFKNETFAKQLPVTKNYLYKLILKSLGSYHAERRLEIKLNQLFSNISILYHKGLYSDCNELVISAKQMAKNHDDYQAYLTALDWDYRIQNATGFIYVDKTYFEHVLQEELYYLECIQQFIRHRNLQYQAVNSYRKKGFPTTQAEINYFTSFLSEPLLDGEVPEQRPSKLSYYAVRSMIYLITGKHEMAYKTLLQQKSVFEESDVYLQENLGTYAILHNNIILSLKSLNRFDECFDVIQQLKKIKPRTIEDRVRMFIATWRNELRLCVSTGDFEKGLEFIPEMEKELDHLGSRIDGEMRLLIKFYVFFIYFGAEKYRLALQWLNRILNTKIKIRSDLIGYSRILNIIVHYELKNYFLVESLIKSNYRYFSQRNALSEFEEIILSFFSESLKMDARADLVRLFQSTKSKLVDIRNEQPENRAFEYFDFIAWLNSKIENKSFSECIKENLDLIKHQ